MAQVAFNLDKSECPKCHNVVWTYWLSWHVYLHKRWPMYEQFQRKGRKQVNEGERIGIS